MTKWALEHTSLWTQKDTHTETQLQVTVLFHPYFVEHSHNVFVVVAATFMKTFLAGTDQEKNQSGRPCQLKPHVFSSPRQLVWWDPRHRD